MTYEAIDYMDIFTDTTILANIIFIYGIRKI